LLENEIPAYIYIPLHLAYFAWNCYHAYNTLYLSLYDIQFTCVWEGSVITVFTVFRLLTGFVCLYNYEFWLSLCKIVRSSVIVLLPLFIQQHVIFLHLYIPDCYHAYNTLYLSLYDIQFTCVWEGSALYYIRLWIYISPCLLHISLYRKKN
jgi:hypothetical protein